ncbi:MAG: DUF4307 domain-containing protein [Actinobacteria bacterium]|jgi:hypothetical protein|uniref:Unannotated protein n=1 Tax=freshwater metagenome TaxID=449393 RepID=A0A6J6EZT5_9ZZZZ|nr:DUF4307 domain-containing protein [Actinomycetota bacterium]
MPLSKAQWEQLPPDVKARYPKPGSNLGLWLVGALAIVTVSAFVGLGFSKYVDLPATGKLTGFEIPNESVVITRFEVNRDPGTRVTCALRAQDDRRVDVGYAWVEIVPSDERVSALSYPLATRSLAVLVEILGCSAGTEVTGVPLPQVEPGTELPEQPAPGRKPPNL